MEGAAPTHPQAPDHLNSTGCVIRYSPGKGRGVYGTREFRSQYSKQTMDCRLTFPDSPHTCSPAMHSATRHDLRSARHPLPLHGNPSYQPLGRSPRRPSWRLVPSCSSIARNTPNMDGIRCSITIPSSGRMGVWRLLWASVRTYSYLPIHQRSGIAPPPAFSRLCCTNRHSRQLLSPGSLFNHSSAPNVSYTLDPVTESSCND